MVHGRHQNHDHAGVNSPSQEARRRWSMSSSTAFLVTTEAEAHLPLWAAPRFAFVIAAMEFAAAKQATLRAGLLGQIGVDFFEQAE